MGRFATVVAWYGVGMKPGLLGVVEFFELLVKIDVGVREMMVGSLPRTLGKPGGVQLASYVLLHCTERYVVRIRWGIYSPLNSMLLKLLHLCAADHERSVGTRHCYDTLPMLLLLMVC